MQDFGVCDPVLQRDVTGKLCTLKLRYLKDRSPKEAPEWDSSTRERSEEDAIGKVDLLYSCVLKSHTLEISGSPSFLRTNFIF